MQQNYHPGIGIGLVIRSRGINHRHGRRNEYNKSSSESSYEEEVKVTVKKRD
jgi:hypothetical protein